MPAMLVPMSCPWAGRRMERSPKPQRRSSRNSSRRRRWEKSQIKTSPSSPRCSRYAAYAKVCLHEPMLARITYLFVVTSLCIRARRRVCRLTRLWRCPFSIDETGTFPREGCRCHRLGSSKGSGCLRFLVLHMFTLPPLHSICVFRSSLLLRMSSRWTISRGRVW